DVLKASPNLPNRYNEQEDFKRFRGEARLSFNTVYSRDARFKGAGARKTRVAPAVVTTPLRQIYAPPLLVPATPPHWPRQAVLNPRTLQPPPSEPPSDAWSLRAEGGPESDTLSAAEVEATIGYISSLETARKAETPAQHEVVTWTPGSQASLPLNAATFEADIWGVITMEASEGSAAVSSAVESPNTSLAVLLQPGFPASSDDIRRDLPGFSPRLIAGLRRRAWQAHVATTDLLVGGDDDPAARQRGPWPARNLYLVQANASQEIPNWPADMPQPIPPHRLRVRHGVANRRRLLRSRPAARLRRATNEDTDIFEDDMDDGGGIGFSDLDSDVDLVFDDEEMLVNRPAAGAAASSTSGRDI
ncbi:unnamed protein product, partial [Symbiodinium microadriaticum]